MQESERSLDIDPVGGIGVNVEGDLLFLGENPQTEHAGDAAHWMNIYRELIAFQQGLLSRGEPQGDSKGNGVEPRLSLDAAMLKGQLEKYRGRLEFWYERHWELQGLAIDSQTLVATHRDRKIHLTRREFQLLSFFLAYPNQTFTAVVLARRAWTDAPLSNDQVRIYVARLRARLSDLGLPCHLVSHPRRGYSFECD